MGKYQPSNGSEGEWFIANFCEKCIKEDEEKEILCDILTRTFVFSIDEADYPDEWQYDQKGKPVCTAFDPRHEVVVDNSG